MVKTKTNLRIHISVTLFLAAGILYNSWPLGYILDKQTARAGLASDLELVGHPYNWLFVTGDVLTAVCIITAVLIISPRFTGKALLLVRAGLIVFGLFTAVSALLPSQCTIGVLRCGADHGQGLGLDTVTSSLAALGLLVSLASLVIIRRLRTPRSQLVTIVLVTWSLSGMIFSWLALTNRNARFTQDIFMILSGLAIIVIGLLDYSLSGHQSD